MGIPESIHQLKQEPEIYTWFVSVAMRSIHADLPNLINQSKTSKSNLVARFETKRTDWPKVVCSVPGMEPFTKDEYQGFNNLANLIDGKIIEGHALHTTSHQPGRTKFLTAENPIYVASFCIEPLIKSFSYH